jgi:UDP-glucose 4-epimerase
MKKILITGAKGFIGKNVTRYFKNLTYEVYGIGHGSLSAKDLQDMGIDYWYESDISVNAIRSIGRTFDVIVHCGGGSSVKLSFENPYIDFKRTVNGTLEVLEYIRLYNSNAHLIYPSSPAVQGECNDEPINEDYIGKPESPYGYNKKIAEELCRSYSDKHNIKISIVRLFSVYGNGLKKQLLWDACNKFINANEKGVEFWGTGQETRDFIHIDDVMKLINCLIEIDDKFLLINGGTGIKTTIKEVVFLIREALDSSCQINFNQEKNEGNPIYFWASTKKLDQYDKNHMIEFRKGLFDYVKWVKTI